MARIVIVEDDDVVSEIASDALTDAGHFTSEVCDGRDALGAIHDSDPDLVILDYNLPGQSGLEILRKVRGSRRADAIPVLMLTSQSGRLLKARAERDGVDDYMMKPFEPVELVRRVEALLVGRRVVLATGNMPACAGITPQP